MEVHVSHEPANPAERVSFAGSADRIVALLDLPADDAEVRDIAGMLQSALESAWQTGQAELLDDAVRFAHGRLAVRGLSHASASEIGAAVESAATGPLTADNRRSLHTFLARCTAGSRPTPPPEEAVPGPLSAAYVEHLLQGDVKGAIALTRRCVTDGMDIYGILVDVLEPAQREVGRLWALGHISVAQEHFCTAVTQFVMTDLYPGLFSGEESGRRLMAVHVPGSLHHVGLRMVVDVLECRDWSTTYIVEDVTTESLPGLVADDQADLLLISAAMPGQIAHVQAMIQAVRQDPRTLDVKVVVGGRPFNVAPDLVDAVGADGWARDARTAVDVCNELVGGRP